MKRVKEFIVLGILLFAIIGINGQLDDLLKKAEVEITAIPPVVTIDLDESATERPKIPKLKISPRKISTVDNDDSINETVEYSTKIETIEEIRIVTERPYFAKKLIPKLVKKIDTENEINTSTKTGVTEKSLEIKLVEENEAESPRKSVLFGIKGVIQQENNDDDEEDEEEEEISEDPEPTPHPARPKIRPIITRKPPFSAQRRPFILQSQNHPSAVVSEAPIETSSSSSGKKFVRRRYKKVDYKNGTIEKVYVGPSIEVDPAIRQAKLNNEVTPAPNLPTPIIHGRTTKRGRLTPKRLIGRTTTSKPQRIETQVEVKGTDETTESNRKLYSRRPSLKSFEPIKTRGEPNVDDVEATTEFARKVYQKKPVAVSESEKDEIEFAAENNEEEEEQTTQKIRKILLKRPVSKSEEKEEDNETEVKQQEIEIKSEEKKLEVVTNVEGDVTEKSKDTEVKVENKNDEEGNVDSKNKESENVEVKQDNKVEKTSEKPRRIILKRPKLIVKTSTNDERDQSIKNEEDVTKSPLANKYETTKQRKFIKRLKNIRERPTTTTEAPTTEVNSDDIDSTEASSTEQPSSKDQASNVTEVSKSTISNKLEETLTVTNETLKNEQKTVENDDEPNDIAPTESSVKPGNRFNAASRTSFASRKASDNVRPSQRTNGGRFQSRQKLLLEHNPSNEATLNRSKDTEENTVSRGSAQRYNSRLGSRQRVQGNVEVKKEQTESNRSFRPRNRFESSATVKSETDSTIEKSVQSTKGSSNSELLRRRTGSRNPQPAVISRYGQKTTESDIEVTEDKVEKSTSSVASVKTTTSVVDVTEDNEEENVTEVSEKEINETNSSNETSSITLTEKSKNEEKSTVEDKSTTSKPFSTTVRTGFAFKSAGEAKKIEAKKETQLSSGKTKEGSKDILSESGENFFKLVKDTHQKVIENVVSSLPSFKDRTTSTTKAPTTTTTTTRRTTTTTTTRKPYSPTTTKKPLSTTTTKKPLSTTTVATQTAAPVVQFVIQDNSYYSLQPSRTIVPQVPILSDSFRRVSTEVPSREVQSPFNIKTEIKVDDSNSASRFRVTVPSPAPVSLSTSFHRQTPSVVTTTKLPHSASVSSNFASSSFDGVSQNTFGTAANRFQSGISNPTVSRPTQTFTTTQFTSHHTHSRPHVEFNSDNQAAFSYHGHRQTYVSVAPKVGTNRGRGGFKFNQQELHWNKEIWSTADERPEGFYNFIKY